jgi:hypothetical protein
VNGSLRRKAAQSPQLNVDSDWKTGGLAVAVNDQVIQGIRARVEQCRRLASMINHPEARQTLLQMAQDGEADIQRLKAETQSAKS